MNDSARSMMAATKKFAEDIGGALVAGGTSTALTVTSKEVLSSGHIANGLRVCVRTASAATGAATIAIDGLTATDIKKNDGTAIVAGDWASGAILDLVYSSTASAFIAANLPQASGGSSQASFSAYATSGGSFDSTLTKVTFGNEEYDVGSYFSSSRWTPPSGKVLINSALTYISVSSGTDVTIAVYKNGSLYRSNPWLSGGGTGCATITMMDSANGTDYYEIYASGDGVWFTAADANGKNLIFQGTMI